MRVLVCGGRKFDNRPFLFAVLDLVHGRDRRIDIVIEGGARGADRLAREWAVDRGVPFRTFEADWDLHRSRAGPARNRKMYREGQPDVVLAFEGGSGTADMMRVAEEGGTRVVRTWDLTALANFLESL